jgi:hypothetical protein
VPTAMPNNEINEIILIAECDFLAFKYLRVTKNGNLNEFRNITPPINSLNEIF